MNFSGLLLFSIGLPIALYLLNAIFARGFQKIDVKLALIYISSMAMMGVFGEIFVGSIYNFLFGRHLWDYTIYPIHKGFTSLYAPVVWGSYGFFLYLFHETIKKYKNFSELQLGIIFCIETIIMEALINGIYKLIFGEYLFYYNPGDLWHLTSIHALPFYFIAGVAMAKIVRHNKKSAKFYVVLNIYLMAVLVFLAN